MNTKLDETKNKQASQIIAQQIAKLPENTPMDNNTLGSTMGMTKREGEAHSMANYFVKRLYGLEIADKREDDQERIDIVKSIVNAALEITGK